MKLKKAIKTIKALAGIFDNTGIKNNRIITDAELVKLQAAYRVCAEESKLKDLLPELEDECQGFVTVGMFMNFWSVTRMLEARTEHRR